MVKPQSTRSRDGGSNPTRPLHFNIIEITHKVAKNFILKWHYSERMPTGKKICYGLYFKDKLYAAIAYGIGVNPYQARFLKSKCVIEILRMCRSEPKLEYPLSRFISITSRWIKSITNCDTLVAFADPEYGHEGTVYKASGFILHGKTEPAWHLIGKNGEKRHRRYTFRYAKRKNISTKQARQDLGFKRVKTEPKFRWIRRI